MFVNHEEVKNKDFFFQNWIDTQAFKSNNSVVSCAVSEGKTHGNQTEQYQWHFFEAASIGVFLVFLVRVRVTTIRVAKTDFSKRSHILKSVETPIHLDFFFEIVSPLLNPIFKLVSTSISCPTYMQYKIIFTRTIVQATFLPSLTVTLTQNEASGVHWVSSVVLLKSSGQRLIFFVLQIVAFVAHSQHLMFFPPSFEKPIVLMLGSLGFSKNSKIFSSARAWIPQIPPRTKQDNKIVNFMM